MTKGEKGDKIVKPRKKARESREAKAEVFPELKKGRKKFLTRDEKCGKIENASAFGKRLAGKRAGKKTEKILAKKG